MNYLLNKRRVVSQRDVHIRSLCRTILQTIFTRVVFTLGLIKDAVSNQLNGSFSHVPVVVLKISHGMKCKYARLLILKTLSSNNMIYIDDLSTALHD